ncbi:MAG TPA: sigma 54-interacting transcriptional regulator [Polyangia bacterium]|nr:sigma 54-interacting transcriptional regulator [Polyangia bacterium]
MHTTVIEDHEVPVDADGGQFLLVVGRDSYTTYNLPASGTLTIGRGESNAVRVDDPLASRAHARLHVHVDGAENMYLEDLGSVNGTRLKDQALVRGQKVRVVAGETIQIGSSVLIVQTRAKRAPLLRPETLRDEGMLRPTPTAPDQAMLRIQQLAARAAAGTINVLITGETGVGKELLAETVHRLSPRKDGPYVCLNCAALSETLLESELFGHERGAFTGAVQAKPGLMETAHGGTLFMDEVGELPLTTQAKLLRVLETREVSRLGSVKPRKIDLRFLAATNRDLEAEVSRGTFRRDLYFRLNGITLTIPPLRSRVGEIRRLADTFVQQICRELGRPEPAIPERIAVLLESYAWPGNIRELKNVMERAVLLCTGPVIDTDVLPMDKLGAPPSTPGTSSGELPASGPPDERQRIVDALAACAGNQSRAAKILGISRRTLVARLDDYKIPRPKKSV